jgi:hypothetical protein
MPAKRGTKNQKIEATEARAILEVTKDMDMNKVIAEVGGLQVNVQNSLAALSAALTAKIQTAKQLDEAITLKEARLHELHGIEADAVTLDDMKAQKEAEEQDWQSKRAERARLWAEEEVERTKKWKRETEDHDYTFKTHSKKVSDEFESEVATHRRNEQVRQEMLQKSWTDREMAIKGQEQELNDLRKGAETFDARLKSGVGAAEAILANKLKGDFEHQLKLVQKDCESEKNANGIKNAAYEMTIKGLENQITDLKGQLTDARKDAKEVATQALQSASQRGVADALQRVVDTQSNNSPSKK